MSWFCGRAWRCCLGLHWWVKVLIGDPVHGLFICGRKGCDAQKVTTL